VVKQMQTCDIAIVGAGIGGLSFLWKLLVWVEKTKAKTQKPSSSQEQQNGKFKILFLDKKDRIGGRICTFRSPEDSPKTERKTTTTTKLIEEGTEKENPEIESTKYKQQRKQKYKITFEGGPSRFSEHHTELLKLLKELNLKTTEIGKSTQSTPSSSGYPSLRVEYRQKWNEDRKELMKETMKQYGLDKDLEIQKFLSRYNYDSSSIYIELIKLMNKDFENYPKWNIQFSGISFLRFYELLLFYLVTEFELAPALEKSQVSKETIEIKHKIEKIKNEFSKIGKLPKGILLSSFSQESQNRGLAVLGWLSDSLGYSAELEMSAIFGRGLVAEVSAKQKWLVLSDEQAKELGGLHGFASLFFNKIQAKVHDLKDFVSLETSLGQELRQLRFSEKGQSWILKCTSNSGVDAHSSSWICKDIVFTGSNLNLEEVLILPVSSSSLEKKQHKRIPVPILFNYIYRSTTPRVLLRVFAQFLPDPSTNKFWFDGIPRILSSGPLRMMIPMQSSKFGVFQVSYTDWRYSEPWLKLLEIGKQDGSIKPPTPTNVDFGYAKIDSKFGIALWKEIQKVFPEIQIPKPQHIVYHPCICHYAEPETSEGFEAATKVLKKETNQEKQEQQLSWTYKELGILTLHPLPGLFLAGEAYNNQEVSGIPSAWMESAIRTANLCFMSWELSKK
jgi:hypothetical protein